MILEIYRTSFRNRTTLLLRKVNLLVPIKSFEMSTGEDVLRGLGALSSLTSLSLNFLTGPVKLSPLTNLTCLKFESKVKGGKWLLQLRKLTNLVSLKYREDLQYRVYVLRLIAA